MNSNSNLRRAANRANGRRIRVKNRCEQLLELIGELHLTNSYWLRQKIYILEGDLFEVIDTAYEEEKNAIRHRNERTTSRGLD